MFPPSKSQAPLRKKENPKLQLLWAHKMVFLWFFLWHNLSLASKSSARGLDLLRDQLCVTTNLVEASTPHGVGQGGWPGRLPPPTGLAGRGGLPTGHAPDSDPGLLPFHSGSTCLGPGWCPSTPISSQCILPTNLIIITTIMRIINSPLHSTCHVPDTLPRISDKLTHCILTII